MFTDLENICLIIYRFNEVLGRCIFFYSFVILNGTVNIIWSHKSPWVAKAISWEQLHPNCKVYYNLETLNGMKTNGPMWQNQEPKINRVVCSQMFDRESRITQGESNHLILIWHWDIWTVMWRNEAVSHFTVLTKMNLRGIKVKWKAFNS